MPRSKRPTVQVEARRILTTTWDVAVLWRGRDAFGGGGCEEGAAIGSIELRDDGRFEADDRRSTEVCATLDAAVRRLLEMAHGKTYVMRRSTEPRKGRMRYRFEELAT